MKEIEIIDLNMPYGGWVIRGYHLKQDIVDAINKYEEKTENKYTIDDLDFSETYAHWCYGTWEGESDMRYLQCDDKYKGVRGGFAVTYVDNKPVKKE